MTFKFPAPLPKGAQNGLLDDGVKATVALKALKYLYVNFGLLTVVPMKQRSSTVLSSTCLSVYFKNKIVLEVWILTTPEWVSTGGRISQVTKYFMLGQSA